MATLREEPVERDGPVATGPFGTLEARALDHRIDSYGYRLVEPDGRRMLPAELARAGIAGRDVGLLRREGALRVGGRLVTVEEVSVPRPGQRFAFVMDTRLSLYQDRVGWTAARLERDPRTARRRIDEAIHHHVAQLAAIGSPPPDTAEVAARAAPEAGWHTAELRVMLALDRARPEAVEQRRIVADQDDLAELDLAITPAVASAGAALEADVFYGGTLVDRGMESSDRRGFALALPRALTRGQSHDFAVHYRLPGRAMRPHVVCVPRRPCTLFDLRVRFDREHPPPRVWLLRGVFQRDVSDPVRGGDTQAVDGAGEVHLAFHDLSPGLAYGVRWGR